MQNKFDEKKIKPLTIILGLIVFLIVYLVVVAVLIYGFNVSNKLTRKTAAIFPYPVAAWGGTNFITESKLKGQLDAARMFYENQDFSDLGLRVDFTTEDGKKRLAIKEKNILNKLIENRLIENEAKKRGLTINPEDISQAVSRKMQEYGSEEYLKNNLTKLYGWTLTDFQENIVKPDMYKEKLFANIQETDPEMIAAKSKIDAALQELNAKKDFASVAGKYSEGESAKSDGELGWFDSSEMLPEIAQVVFGLNKGDRSEIIMSSLGYHIVLVEDKKTENGVDKVQLKQIFVRTNNFSDWLDKFVKSFNIHIFSRDMYWNKTDGQVEFKNNDLKDFENNLQKNSPGDISVLF
ncbi:MAG: peptidylprolyl isomerase [Candidatus Moranbacteria bacterium]|nr:peptidylprolyl isomerase [Candidatus Moranbacteria bacterium]